MRIAIFDNLANSAYILAKVLRELGYSVDLVLDPADRYAMSDPRWEDLDLELPSDQLMDVTWPPCELPDWIRTQPAERNHLQGGRFRRNAGKLGEAPGLAPAWRTAMRRAGWRGIRMTLERAWVVSTLADYDCVIAFGAGPMWAALAGVPCVAVTWGGDITMLPFYDIGGWEGQHEMALPGPRRELFAAARLQRMGYEHSGRIILTDPRFAPFAERLGVSAKCVDLGFLIDTERYSPGPEAELRGLLLGDRDGLVVFVPSRQDWYWKGSDRLLRGFAQAAEGRSDVALVCAGWGADLERSEQLIAELGIAERVRLLPNAMSKGRLLRYYRAADIVADQFTVGSYGGSALETMSCARPLLISLTVARFEGRFESLPPVMNVSEPAQIAAALSALFDDPQRRRELGQQARDWVVANHSRSVARRVAELCREALGETASRAHSAAR